MNDAAQDNGYKYNGKELNEDWGLGWYDYGARWYMPDVGRWGAVDPLAEKYSPFSPFGYAADSPIMYIDPNGAEIFIWHWDSGTETWVKGHLNKETAEIFKAFAQTSVGKNFLAKYAKQNQVLGGLKFLADGKYADQNLNFFEYSQYGNDIGGSSFRINGNKVEFDIKLNYAEVNEPFGRETSALTIGHEAFIHTDQTDDLLISAIRTKNQKQLDLLKKEAKESSDLRAKPAHDKYIKGVLEFSKLFNEYYLQLVELSTNGKIKVLNSSNIKKAKIKHDNKYK
jgi:RHS repeat-associated protein